MTNSDRVDSASRYIVASPTAVYRAFSEPSAIVQWMAPAGMTGTMLAFDFREGGSYRMRLTYSEPGQGKTTADADEFSAQWVRLVDGECIEQAIAFDSSDPQFAGVMRMIWTFQPGTDGTLVTVRCENVPAGIRPEDHEVGLNSTLANLAAFLESE
ncbi:ATPase [Natronospirillum operosum]|uniref:ATPase n=1 Tax=Natronospirillum operosum TaxID=2759953 RepID=A0A4Z0WD85_9GAMM|nr:ATPase [Natronospirillum operosum]